MTSGDSAQYRVWTLCDTIIVISAVTVPNAITILLFSAAGFGLTIFDFAAAPAMSRLGSFLFFCAFLLMGILYIAELHNWRMSSAKIAVVSVPWALLLIGCILKSLKYPYMPIVSFTLNAVVLPAVFRTTLRQPEDLMKFYNRIKWATLLCLISMLVFWAVYWSSNGWNNETRAELAKQIPRVYDHVYNPKRYEPRALNYTQDCGPHKNLTLWSSEVKSAIKGSCAKASTIMFMTWSCPLICCFVDLGIFVFVCLIADQRHDDEREKLGLNTSVGSQEPANELRRLEKIFKSFICALVFGLLGLYASCSYVSAVSLHLSGALMAFFTAALAILFVWLYNRVGYDAMRGRITNISQSHVLKFVPGSMWSIMRAMAVISLNVLIPVLAAFDRARQIRRNYWGLNTDIQAKAFYSPEGMSIYKWLSAWPWANTLWWVCTLCELYVLMQIGAMKFTYVGLSWLKGALPESFAVVTVICFVTGFIMFMLPPVPGVAVYVFVGMVLADHQGLGNFVLGCIISCCLCWILKLVACCGQYLIGFLAGQAVTVQSLIGVDQPSTRALMMILQKPGLSLGKVGVLVGGPDWPVSVGCGVIRLNVIQMLVGTSPVIFVLAPCVLAGAFTAKKTSDDSIEAVLSSGFMGLSSVVQIAAGVLATYYTIETIAAHGDALSESRPEHIAVEEESARKAQIAETFKSVTEWSRLDFLSRWSLIIASSLLLVSNFCFVFFSEMCFENFAISGKISDPIDENGLDGNAMNVIRPPGYDILVVFLLGCLVHFCYCRRIAALLKEAIAAAEPSVNPQVIGAQTFSADGTAMTPQALAQCQTPNNVNMM